MALAVSDDLMAPGVIVDPHSYYRGLRERDPVHWNDRWGGWVLTRYDEQECTGLVRFTESTARIQPSFAGVTGWAVAR